MPSVGTDLFVQFPSESSQHVLHPGMVRQATSGGFIVQVDEADLPAEAGQEVLIFFEHQRQFMQQPARIDVVMESGPDVEDENAEAAPPSAQRILSGNDEPMGPMLGIETTGDMVSAESRECYRICTVLADITATVGDETDCPVLDVSATGFAVFATQQHPVAGRLHIELSFDGHAAAGDVCIQSSRELADGRYRYGLHCATKGDQAFARAMQQISMAVQRAQLRRMSGATA